MRPTLKNLVDLLALERIDRDLFRGTSQDRGWGAIFGGRVFGQALSAATQTVAPDRTAHSAHGYFIRAGDLPHPIVYQVDRLRDGKSLSTRNAIAVQDRTSRPQRSHPFTRPGSPSSTWLQFHRAREAQLVEALEVFKSAAGGNVHGDALAAFRDLAATMVARDMRMFPELHPRPVVLLG